ncbi:translocator protein-like isoform X2 [Cyprinodon tularosa]|uniref:translocator protein-like isoform X2 n=1 Tax=Cyprinodon variegatus TaxID=28743 RepID=UPI000742AB04|nr:PREDICTED: translocator protein-like isoform X2 [Cyprinodon variegatus]XP_038142346.1 translocator protein-like isoform X2 [Cyprinodon tularosa]
MSLQMIGFTALPHVGGILGGFIRRKEVYTWYGSYLIWKELGGFTEDAVAPMGLYGLQLALNWASVPLFFSAHSQKWGFLEIVLLDGAIGATMLSWYPINRTASLLLAPYLAWMCYTTAIRYCIWRDNPDEKEE